MEPTALPVLRPEGRRLSTPKEIATALQVSLKTLYYWVSRNEIPYIKIGKHLRFDIPKVIDHFQARTDASRMSCLPSHDLLNLLKSNRSFSTKTNRTTRPAGKE